MLNILDSIKGAISSVTHLLDTITTTDEERAKAKAHIIKIQNELLIKGVELESQMLENHRQIMLADANSKSWMARNWRPIVSFGLFVLVAIKYGVDVIHAFNPTINPIEFDSNFWLAIGGLWGITAFTRGAENTVSKWKNQNGNIRM